MAEFYSATVRLFDRFCGPVLLRDSHNSRLILGTKLLVNPPSQMPSSTGWCTTPTGSNSTDNPSERKTLNYVTKHQKTDIKTKASRQRVKAGRIPRYKWADVVGIGGRISRNMQALIFDKFNAGEVASPGGYLRGMVEKAGVGELHLDRSFYGRLNEVRAA